MNSLMSFKVCTQVTTTSIKIRNISSIQRLRRPRAVAHLLPQVPSNRLIHICYDIDLYIFLNLKELNFIFGKSNIHTVEHYNGPDSSNTQPNAQPTLSSTLLPTPLPGRLPNEPARHFSSHVDTSTYTSEEYCFKTYPPYHFHT